MTQKSLILALESSSRIGAVAIALGEKLLAETTFSSPMRHSAEIFPAISGLLERFGKRPQEIEHIYISVGPGSFTGIRIAVTMAKTMHLANAAKIVAVDSLDVITANVINITPDSYESRVTNHEPRITSHEPRATNHEIRDTRYEKVAAILDAKRNQFFIAVYEKRPKEHKYISAQDDDRKHAARDTQYAILTTSHRSLSPVPYPLTKILPDSLMTSDEFLEKFADPHQPVWLLGDGLLYHRGKFKTDGVRFLDEKYWSPRAEKVHSLGWQMALSGQFADPLTLTPNYLLRPDIKVKRC